MIFYKYIHFNDDTEFSSITKSIFEDRKLMFPLTKNINDPNEFKFSFLVDKSKREINLKHYLKENPGKSEKDYDIWINSITTSRLNYSALTARAQLISEYKVLSLSMTHKSNLLWSHYTNVHKGFCVVYTKKLKNIVDSKFNISCGPVLYTDKVPRIKYLEEENEEIIKKIFFTKEKTWEYEKEYRFVIENNTPKPFFLEINKDCIFGAIFGSRMTSENKSYLEKICELNGYKMFQSINPTVSYIPYIKKHDPKAYQMTSLI